MNLFKFDQSKPIQRSLLKIYILKIYDFLLEEFRKLRSEFPDFHYFSVEEEKRYLEAIRVLCNDESSFINEEGNLPRINLVPSKMGFLLLRYIRYHIFKINKYLFRTESEKNQHKLSFYVRFKI